MILSAHQPTFMPWAGLFEKIERADTLCLFDAVAAEDSGYENRVQIKTAQGPQWLTVPIKRSRDLPLYKVEIANEHSWARKMVRSLEMNYAKAPYFEQYHGGIKGILETRYQYLADLDLAMLGYLMEALNIKTPIVRASEYAFEGTKSALVLDMCKQLGATRYIFGSQGHAYADARAFAEAGIRIEFQDYQCRPYRQQHGDFVGGLSVVDALFNCGPGARKVVLG